MGRLRSFGSFLGVMAILLEPASSALRAQTLVRTAPVESDKGGISGGVETDIASRYLFRGVPYSQGPVKQSTTWLTIKDLHLYSRGNLILGREPMQGRFNEIDVGVSYPGERLRLSWTPGFDCFFYRSEKAVRAPPSAAPTCEASVKLRYSLGKSSLFTEQIVDTGNYRGAYYGEAGLSHEHVLSPRTILESSLRAGWANAKFNESYAGLLSPGLNFAGIGISLTHNLDRRVYVKPHLELAATLNRHQPGNRRSPILVSVGLAIGYRWSLRHKGD